MPYALSLMPYALCFMNPVYLKLSRATAALPVEASRFWGNPALPEGVEYPQYIDDDGCQYPYVFICQINLAELKAFCGEIANPLPSSGLLLFFAKIDHYLGMAAPTGGIMGAISDTEAVKVIHVADLTDLREIVLVDEDDQPMSPHELEITFSHHHDPLNDEDHALFARPDHREWATWDPPYEDWQILLQVDSFSSPDFNLNFMDFGVLDILISPAALRAASFTNLRALVLST